MRICIDATALLLRSAGVKNYLYHWMRALQQQSGSHEITAFPMLGAVGGLDHNRSVLRASQTIPRIALLHFANIRFNPFVDILMKGTDVFHASNLMRNVPRGPKLTGTIYDMTAKLLPQFHTEGNVRAETAFYENVLKRADGLIAISHSAKSDAVRLLGLDPRRISVIYPGIDTRFFDPAPSEIERVKAAHRLSKPYLLFVGTIEPRKNVDTLLDAWAVVSAEIRQEHDLVIAGPIGWASGSTVARLRSAPAGVRVLGYVPEADLPGLTAGAHVFVYPSFYEGFGFPVAQAMAAGVPVITSAVSSLPEVVADAGVLVDPHASTELAAAMSGLLTSESKRTQLGLNGRKSARRFTWNHAATESHQFFEQVVASALRDTKLKPPSLDTTIT